jgi:plasmid maintenance system killer protein
MEMIPYTQWFHSSRTVVLVILGFETERLAKLCNEEKKLVRAFGLERARRIQLRLTQVRAADTLEDLREAPGNWHELTADRHGQVSADLNGPNRLISRPTDPEGTTRPDGGLDWTLVTEMTVVEIADTHD